MDVFSITVLLLVVFSASLAIGCAVYSLHQEDPLKKSIASVGMCAFGGVSVVLLYALNTRFPLIKESTIAWITLVAILLMLWVVFTLFESKNGK